MQALQCDICGGSLEMDISGEFAKCESCGMKHTKGRMKQKVQEITGTVKIDGTVSVEGIADVENLLKRAENYLNDMEYEKCEEYCNKILDIDINNKQAVALQSRINNIKEFQSLCTQALVPSRLYVEDYVFNGNAIQAYNKIKTLLGNNEPHFKKILKKRYIFPMNSRFTTTIVFLLHQNDTEVIKYLLEEPFQFSMEQDWTSGKNRELYNNAYGMLLSNDDLLGMTKQNIKDIDKFLCNCIGPLLDNGVELALLCGANPNQRIVCDDTTYNLISCLKHRTIGNYMLSFSRKRMISLLKEYGGNRWF